MVRSFRWDEIYFANLVVDLIQPSGGQDWTPVRGVLYEPVSEIFSQSQVQSNFAKPNKLALEAMIQTTPPDQIFTHKESESYLSLIKFKRTT